MWAALTVQLMFQGLVWIQRLMCLQIHNQTHQDWVHVWVPVHTMPLLLLFLLNLLVLASVV